MNHHASRNAFSKANKPLQGYERSTTNENRVYHKLVTQGYAAPQAPWSLTEML